MTRVQFSLDDSGVWQDMRRDGQGPVWLGFWDAAGFNAGFHTITVRATGSATATDQVNTFINPLLHIGDADGDGDVDGVDLAAFLHDLQPEVTIDVAAAFGGRG